MFSFIQLYETSPFGPLPGIAILLLFILVVVVTILWILLPFAVFGIKDILREIHDELQLLNRRLAKTGKATPE